MAEGRDALRARLRALFVDELEEHVGLLNRGLLALEQGAGDEGRGDLVTELFRSAHSLKGAAQSAGVEAVGALCHRLEDVLSAMRDDRVEVATASLQPLFAAVDAIAAAGARLRAGEDVAPDMMADAVQGLAAPLVRRPEGDQRQGAGPMDDGPPATEPNRSGPESPPPAVEAVARGAPGEGTSVRVATAKLESLLNQAGELLLACHRIGDHALNQVGHALAQGVREARMLPFAQACDGLDRVVRDLSKAGGKEVVLEVRGGDVELDRPILQAIREPLLHLVRNAVDHGIEPAEERAKGGKRPAGSVTVCASVQGGGVEVTVSDDGAGIDAAAVRKEAARLGMAVPQDPSEVPLDLVFSPGLSTAPMVTDRSGRGVGLDAVRAGVERHGGSVAVASAPGVGTVLSLKLPLTLSTVRVLLVAVGGEVMGLPTAGVARLVRPSLEDLVTMEGRQMLLFGDRLVPVVSLARALGLGHEGDAVVTTFHGVVVEAVSNHAVLLVDDLIGEQEVVVKSLGPRLEGVPLALGGTILPSGRVAVILNSGTCARLALSGPPAPALGAPPRPAMGPAKKRILLAEDTFTTRALERSILEAAGYEVLVAVDGADAWQLLQQHGADLVVSDVNMPRMDGFALCQAIRGSSPWRDVPVMLVTSLDSEDDRRRGVEAGADAYVVKSSFQQSVLLDTIEQLL